MERAGARRAAGLSGYGNSFRVSAKLRNIFFYPTAGLTHVEQGIVAAASATLFCQLRMGEEAEKIQPVVDRNNDHIPTACKAGTITYDLTSASCNHAAAVYPEKYRESIRGGFCGSPDV